MIDSIKDPMGQAVYDYFDKHKTKRLRVDSSLTEDEEIEIAYLFRDFDEMPKVEQLALNACKGKVLDVGACSGSHSLCLQQMKFDVAAIDFSDLSVNVMRKRGVNEVKCADFFQLSNESYDTLLFLMNGVGIAGSLLGLDKFLQQCKVLLNENGQILLDSSDIIYLFDDVDEFSTEPGEYYGEMEYQMQYGEVIGDTFDWLFIGFDLLAEYASKHGFKCELVHEGEHYDYLARLTN